MLQKHELETENHWPSKINEKIAFFSFVCMN